MLLEFHLKSCSDKYIMFSTETQWVCQWLSLTEVLHAENLNMFFIHMSSVISRVCAVVFRGKNLMLDITHLAIDSHAGQIFGLVDATKPAIW